MKRSIITVIALLVTVVITSFMLMLNDIVISIRLNELRDSLQKIDTREGNIDHISLVATYEIHKKLFEKTITQDKADSYEQEINSLLIFEKNNQPPFYSLYNAISTPALKIINFNRMILGKMPLTYNRTDDSEYINMDLAYFYERNFQFKRAIELYEKSLDNKNLTDNLKASILLHQGYCYALAGFNEKARYNYNVILEKYIRENSSITATILLGYLDGFHRAQQYVLDSKDDPILRSQNLVNLLAYKQALTILETSEHAAKPDDLVRIKYFKARCFGGLGETEKAVSNYLEVITSSPSSQYAKYSNRKLFMIGSSGKNNSILKISKDLNVKLNDPVMTQMIRETGDINITDVAKQDEIINISLPSNLLDKINSMTSEKKKPAPPKNRYLIISTSDGNTFKGTLIEDVGDYIALDTSIGKIQVKKDKIKKITEK